MARVFKDYADSCIKTTVPATCKASTLKDYEDILRLHVGPVFYDISFTEITRGKIKDFLRGKKNVCTQKKLAKKKELPENR